MRRFTLGMIVALMAGLFTACGPTPPPRFQVWDLGTLGGDHVVATDINNSGQVVGYAVDGTGQPRAFRSNGATMTDLGTLGGPDAFAAAVNDAGQVTGGSRPTATGRSHAFVRPSAGPMTDLGTLGGATDLSEATDINAAGDVVGGSYNTSNTYHAFVKGPSTGGVMTDLGALSPTGYSTALAINANGDIVGNSLDATGRDRAFLKSGTFTGGQMRDLGTLGGANSVAMDVNQSGFVVGAADNAAGKRRAMGIVYGGAMVDLGTLGGITSQAIAVNDENDIVGSSTTTSGVTHAFLHEGFTMVDLNSLIPTGTGWELVSAMGINDHGQIVGTGRHNGVVRAFLLNPSPEAAIGDVALLEGNSGTRVATFVVTLDHTTSATVTVNYGTVNGTGAAPGDYTSALGTLTFSPFQKSKTISITIKGDTLVEPDERFVVDLAAPTGITIGDNQGQGTIRNDD